GSTRQIGDAKDSVKESRHRQSAPPPVRCSSVSGPCRWSTAQWRCVPIFRSCSAGLGHRQSIGGVPQFSGSAPTKRESPCSCAITSTKATPVDLLRPALPDDHLQTKLSALSLSPPAYATACG